MMSHEEHRRHSPGEEEDGEDEEQDMEARTAVEALLALTSPTDYTHHTGYEEEYMMDPVSEGYPKVVSEKDGVEVYNSMPVEEMEVEESGCIKVTGQNVPITLGTNTAQAQLSESARVSTSESKDVNVSDEGLKQLRAFVQATEGQESVVKVCTKPQGLRSGEKRSAFGENGTPMKVSKGQHDAREKRTVVVVNKAGAGGSEASANSEVKMCGTDKIGERCGDNQKSEQNATKTQVRVAGARDGPQHRNFQGGDSGGTGENERNKTQNTMLGEEDDDEEESSESESEATEPSRLVERGGAMQGKLEGNNSDTSDSDGEDGDSDSSSSSSGSDSSSSDSDSDGSESDSESESDSKCTVDKGKGAVPAAAVTGESSVIKSGASAAMSERKDSEVRVKEHNSAEDTKFLDKRRPSDLLRVADKVKAGDSSKPSEQALSDPNKPSDKVKVMEQQVKDKKSVLYKEGTGRETKTQKGEKEVTVTVIERRKSSEVCEERHVSQPESSRDMDSLSNASSDTERKSETPKDSRKDVSDGERQSSVESRNCITSKPVEKTDKTLSGIKLSNEKKLFNNNSISITKSQANLSTSNNLSKKNIVIKAETQAMIKVPASLPKLTTKPSGTTNSSPRAGGERSPVDLVQEVAATFAKQLSAIQASHMRNSAGRTDQHAEEGKCPQEDHSSSQVTQEEDEKADSEIEDMFPIQAEVVMSEGSESGLEYETFADQAPQDDLSWCRKGSEVLDPSEKENVELMAYLKSYVNGGREGEVVEYPPPNNDLPPGGRDLTQWQLDEVRLPPFTPSVAPPSWLRLTIPAEGYRCQSCDDTFFIESSLVQHRERRSVWISLECGPCDAKLTFYNRCALKDHLRNHMLRGEEVDEETVEVRSLPLQLTRLLQPIVVPVPDSLRMRGKKVGRNLKSHGSVNKMPVLKPIGRCGSARLDEYQNDAGATSLEEEQEDAVEQEEEMRSPTEKIPPGIKRLSPRKRTVRCYLCERMFHSVRELMAHMRTDQPYSDQRVECKKCQLVLPSVCAAKAHILTHPPANTSNISVCPECGSRCDGPREFVHHLNTCGHQYRRSGVVCTVCQVCFFRSQDDFLTHWIAEHCAKSYECVVCRSTFESLVFHRCTSPGQQVLATFRCLLTCPLCSVAVQLHAQEEQDTNGKIRAHLAEAHPTIITRVHYVYKSKFCTNAFRSKDELRAHHDREHRRDNHYRTKTCTLHHEVLGYQHQYFSGQEPRNAFVTLPVALSAEELHEARIRDVPTVSSVIDKTLFPDMILQESGRGVKGERPSKNKVAASKGSAKEVEAKEGGTKDGPVKKDMDQLDKLRPKVCYRCGIHYADNKDFRRHKRTCEGESAERQCRLCGLTAVGEDFARHCLGHVQEGAILCIYCNGTQFATTADLEQHFELHVHEQFSYPASCAFCCTSLPDVPSALAHLNEEHDPLHIPFDTSEFECDRCGRRFHGERGLSVHLGRCTLGTATPTPASAGCRQCQVCTKALTPEMFGRHMVCHLEEGLLVCSLCDGRTLPSSMALLHHLEEHAASLAYPSSCPMCTFSMEDSTSALTHLKEEHGFGNLHCADCDMHFNFTYQLQRHTDIVHKICQYAKRRYICWICRAYDHVKKETLMNHFRTVHGLDRQQVDEKVMIRTRGQGTMPTSQFIPTKPLGSKENQGLATANKDTETPPTRTQRDKSKSSPSKSSTGTDSPVKQSGASRSPLKDSPQKTVTPQESPIKEEVSKMGTSQGMAGKDNLPKLHSIDVSGAGDSSNALPPSKRHPSLLEKKIKDKSKVLVKRLPNSILDEESRTKRRKTEGQRSEGEPDIQDGVEKKERKKKKKKKKAYKCQLCLYGTNFKDKMDAHLLKHRENGEEVGDADGFVCRECGASFVVEPSLARHMFFAHKVKLQVSSADENDETTSAPPVPAPTALPLAPALTPAPPPAPPPAPAPVLPPANTHIKIEPDSEAKPMEERRETRVKQEVREVPEEVKQERTVAKRKTLRETVRKKPETEAMKTRGERSRRVEAASVKKRPSRPNPKRKPERAVTQTALTATSSRRKEDTSRRKAKEGRRNLERVTVKREYLEDDYDDDTLDNQCVVCKEEFTNPVELYSHLRTHGMAFLKLGRKARPLGLGKPLER
ncbi:Zinc finger protein 532 [Portunus trituberculatus]|uniref:Zinc finger protein 532 n=1 Tax=Portunus trituberculatus TaxID=210409 RepID=A0A5B7CHG8_PORTR|nr:Zinc finger protein 532 [Portunus trituberculatus]